MELASAVKNQIDSRTRVLGNRLFWEGLVEILDGSQDELHARVSGRSPGDVEIRYDGIELRVQCGCYFFEAGGCCRHIWAAIMAADDDGRYLSIGGGPVALVEEDPDNDEIDEYVDDFQLSPVGRAPLPKKPTWRKQFEDLTQQAAASRPEPWPSNRESLYVVDVLSSRQTGRLNVELLFRDARQSGGWGKPKQYRVHRSKIGFLPDENDRRIVAALGGGEDFGTGYYWYKGNQYLPSQFHPGSPLAEMVMPWMCGTGRCWLRPSASPEELLPLSWDDGEPWRFTLDLRQGEGCWLLDGALEREGERMGISEPVLVTDSGLLFTQQ